MNEQRYQSETLAVIRLIGQQPKSHVIPAKVLIRTLTGMQQLVYLMASDSENKKLAQRFRVSEDIERQYMLVCQLPEAGSYLVPLTLEARDTQFSISPEQYVNIFNKVENFLRSLAQGQREGIEKIFLDRTFAKRALIEVRKFLPNADDSWSLGFTNRMSDHHEEVFLVKESVKQIDEWLTLELPSESTTTVTGELIKIDFDEHKVFLRYPPTRGVIECIYSDELEDIMIENRRQYIQVTGEFTVDTNLNPVKLTDVTRIEPLDLSPIILSKIIYKKREFHFKQTLQITPELDTESKQLLLANQSSLGINAVARTREELVEAIGEQVAFLWDDYVKAEDSSLTPEALALKYAVLETVEAQGKDAA